MQRVFAFVRWFGLGLVLLLIGVGLGFGALRYLRARHASVITLPSGATLRCLGVTYGTNNIAPPTSPLLEVLPRPVLRWVGRWLRISTGRSLYPSSKPKLVVWFEVRPPGGAKGGAGGIRALTSIHGVLLDARGQAGGEDATFWGLFSSASPVLGMPFSGFPRRSGECALRLSLLKSTGTRTPLGEVTLRNPMGSHWPDWPAQKLPVPQTNGTLVCTMRACIGNCGNSTEIRGEPDGSESMVYKVAGPAEAPSTAMVFHLTMAGKPAPGWEIVEGQLTDASGNAFSSQSSSRSAQGADLFYEMSPSLWPRETWKVRVWAKRTELRLMAPDELVQTKALPLPPLNETNQFHWAGHCRGVTLRLVRFSRKPPIKGSSFSSVDFSRLDLVASNAAKGTYVDVIQARDDRGRSMVPSEFRVAEEEHSIGFRDIPIDARTIRFTVAVQRGRQFVFRVKPRMLRPRDRQAVFKVSRR